MVKDPLDVDTDADIKICRPAMDCSQLRHETAAARRKLPNKQATAVISSYLSFHKLLPITTWLPSYDWKCDFISDLVAGFTVAVMHIPQGMAYGLLASVDPIAGIYTGFFPVLIYILLGTSRHTSMGTLAVISILVSKPVLQYSLNMESELMLDDSIGVQDLLNKSESKKTTINTADAFVCPVEVLSAITINVGIIQILMGIFNLGRLGCLLSESLVSGYTTGAAIVVLTSQIKHILGITIPQYSGLFRLPKTLYSLLIGWYDLNVVTLSLSICCICVLIFNDFWIQKKLKQFINFLIPIQLIVVIVGTLISKFMQLEKSFHITTVGHIPTGFPQPRFPSVALLIKVLPDCFPIAGVCYFISLSMAKQFATRHNYKIDTTQEFFAQGLANIFGSMFNSIPVAASLSRSIVQETSGGRTLMTSVVSVFFLLWVILFIGPLFEALPHAVLSSIIIVSLKGMLIQLKDIIRYWKQSRTDAFLWFLTFCSTVVLGADFGLAIGLICAVFILLQKNAFPLQVVQLKQFNGFSDLLYSSHNSNYVSKPSLEENSVDNGIITTIYTLKIVGQVNFANSPNLEWLVLKHVSPDMKKSLTESFLVLDLTSLTYIDPSGCQCLVTLYDKFKANGIQTLYVTNIDNVWNSFERYAIFKWIPLWSMFPTHQDLNWFIEQKPSTVSNNFDGRTNTDVGST